MNTKMKQIVIATTIATLTLGSVTTYAAVETKMSRADRKAEIIQAMETAPEDIQTIFTSFTEDRKSLSDTDREILKTYIKDNTDFDVSHKSDKRKGKYRPKIDIENAPEEIQSILEKGKTDRSSITEDDKATLKAYVQEQREEKFAELPEDIQTILLKGKEDRSSISDEEREIIKTYFKKNPDMRIHKGKGKREGKNMNR